MMTRGKLAGLFLLAGARLLSAPAEPTSAPPLVAGPGTDSSEWVSRTPMAEARWNPGAAVVNGRIYVVGGQGRNPPYPSLASMERYDPRTDTWEPRRPMPTSRWGAMVAVAGDRIFVIGGQTGTFAEGFTSTDRVEIYDPATDRWTVGAPMPTRRGWGGAVVMGDSIWVFGGYQPGTDRALAVVEVYSPAEDRWTTRPPMPEPRFTFMTARVGAEIFLIGGWGSARVQRFRPATGEWQERTAMPTARGGGASGVFGGRVYVAGGRGGNADEFQVYDPSSDRWETLQPLATPREGVAGAVVDGWFYALAGSVPLALGGAPYYALNERTRLRG